MLNDHFFNTFSSKFFFPYIYYIKKINTSTVQVMTLVRTLHS